MSIKHGRESFVKRFYKIFTTKRSWSPGSVRMPPFSRRLSYFVYFSLDASQNDSFYNLMEDKGDYIILVLII